MLVITIAIGVVLAGLLVVAFVRARRDPGDVLPDAGVSTLVFPPESKFPASVLPRQ